MLLNAPSRFLYLSQRGCSPHGALVCGHTWRVLPTQQPPTGSRVHHHLASASALLAQAKVSKYFLWLLSPYLPGQFPVHLGSLSSRTVLSCLPSLMSFMGPSSSAHPLKCGTMDPFSLSPHAFSASSHCRLHFWPHLWAENSQICTPATFTTTWSVGHLHSDVHSTSWSAWLHR